MKKGKSSGSKASNLESGIASTTSHKAGNNREATGKTERATHKDMGSISHGKK